MGIFYFYVIFKMVKLPLILVRGDPKLGQIGPKWDKSGDLYDQFKNILARTSPRSVWPNWGQPWHPLNIPFKVWWWCTGISGSESVFCDLEVVYVEQLYMVWINWPDCMSPGRTLGELNHILCWNLRWTSWHPPLDLSHLKYITFHG